MRRLRDFSLCLCLLLLWPLAVNANDSWRQIQTEARGQTVWFNAWGGDPAVNRYLAWVSEEVKRHYAIDLRIVPIADAADAVKRIQSEAQAGRRRGGSVDLLWINGENFRTLKQANLLLTGWAESLPNWRFVDLQKPVREGLFCRHRRYGVAVGQRPADVYRPPRANAAATHQPAGAAGLRQSPSRQRDLPAAAGLHRHRPAGATADRPHRPAGRPAPAAADGDLRGGHGPAVALSRCAAPGPVAGGQGFPGVAGTDGYHAQQWHPPLITHV